MKFKQSSLYYSLHENCYGILLMILSALAVSVGQLLWKISTGGSLCYLAGGFLLYVLGALLMTAALRFGKLSVVHPMLSVSYVFCVILGNVFLKETLVLQQYFAIGCIMFGVAMIGAGDRE